MNRIFASGVNYISRLINRMCNFSGLTDWLHGWIKINLEKSSLRRLCFNKNIILGIWTRKEIVGAQFSGRLARIDQLAKSIERT